MPYNFANLEIYHPDPHVSNYAPTHTDHIFPNHESYNGMMLL
jgi:hypothetical protein